MARVVGLQPTASCSQMQYSTSWLYPDFTEFLRRGQTYNQENAATSSENVQGKIGGEFLKPRGEYNISMYQLISSSSAKNLLLT